MPTKEECLKALKTIEDGTTEIEDYESFPYVTSNQFAQEISVLKRLINEHFDNTPDFKGFKLHSKSYLNTFKKEELIDYIYMVYHNWQGTDSACNHGMKYAEKLQKINDKLEKALDKACELLEDLSRFTPKGSILRTKEKWKEWCLKDE